MQEIVITSGSRVAALTKQQMSVLALISRGFRNKEIACRMGISEKTVKMHRQGLILRLQVRNSHEAVRLAVEAELQGRCPTCRTAVLAQASGLSAEALSRLT